jgi:uncharacterized hydrophobic protein (TIGR00341 family)
MALKLIEMTIGQDAEPFAYDQLDNGGILGIWSHKLENNLSTIRLLVLGRQVEPILDALTEKYGTLEEFRVLVLPVEASLPRFQTNRNVISDSQGHVYVPIDKTRQDRMSREELYVSVSDSATPSASYVALVVLSSLVAAIGVLRDNMAIVIGAMVIAPLLGPSIALALGTALGDLPLIRTAVKANLIGIGLSYVIAVVIGVALHIGAVSWGPSVRITITFTDFALALTSGMAGVLGFTSRLSSALVGVMVAVALLPPLVTTGLLVGMGEYTRALPSGMIFLTNLICVNISAIVTFVAQGIKPGFWDETLTARRAIQAAVAVWMAFLICVLVIIIYRQQVGFFTI